MFFHTLADDGSISYEMLTGEFKLNFCGTYFIKWFVVPQTGLVEDGSSFAVSVDNNASLASSSRVQLSPTVGSSIVEVKGIPPIIKLVNVSDNCIKLSNTAQVTAGIVIFRIGDEI